MLKCVASPLRYPGSKRRLIPWMQLFLEKNYLIGRKIVEPFAGSAIVSLSLLEHNLARSAVLIERDPLIYAFWRSVFERPEELCERVASVTPTMKLWVTMSNFRRFDSPRGKKLIDLGFAGLFLNRTNYSGIISAGPIGGAKQLSPYGVSCRWNPADLIRRINNLSSLSKRIHVKFGDGIEELRTTSDDALAYVDPPYFANGHKFYRYHYKEKNHLALADTLTATHSPWLLSYDVHGTLIKLYGDFQLAILHWYHSARQFRTGSELLISNRDLSFLPASKTQSNLLTTTADAEAFPVID